MKREFVMPAMSVIAVECKDIITTSNDNNDLEFEPTSIGDLPGKSE